MTRPDDRQLARQLRDLAHQARRLPPPSARNPEIFHEARSEHAHQIEQLADALDPRGGRVR